MGFSGFSIGHLLVVLIIVMLVFGTKKIRSLGGDLGHAIKNFRGAMKTGEEDEDENKPEKIEQSASEGASQTPAREKDKV